MNMRQFMYNLIVQPDGTVKALYKDELRPLFEQIGKLTIPRRASDVVFDETDGLWYVFELFDDKTKVKRLPQGFKNRKEAIDYEVKYLQKKYL